MSNIWKYLTAIFQMMQLRLKILQFFYVQIFESNVSDDAIEVGSVDMEARANSGQHHTEK